MAAKVTRICRHFWLFSSLATSCRTPNYWLLWLSVRLRVLIIRQLPFPFLCPCIRGYGEIFTTPQLCLLHQQERLVNYLLADPGTDVEARSYPSAWTLLMIACATDVNLLLIASSFCFFENSTASKQRSVQYHINRQYVERPMLVTTSPKQFPHKGC